jgi:HAD superfamily hydrolase (TIGR01509 family)
MWSTQLLKALIFDFDGLILDTETPELLAWQEIFAGFGVELTVQTWGQVVGGAGVNHFDAAEHLEALLGHPIDRDSVRTSARLESNEAILLQPVLPGARELIRAAKNASYPLAIASSSPHTWVDNHLKRLGMFDYFDAIVCTDDVMNRSKPDPSLFLAALQALNVDASEAVIFEDSPNGIVAANTAGVFCVAVPNVVTSKLDLGKPDLVVHSLEQVSLEDLKTLLQ